MNGAWQFLAIALVLGIVMFLVLRRRWSLAREYDGSSKGKEAPLSSLPELLPQELTVRVFGLQDWEFIEKLQSAHVKRVFLQQRTALALTWLRIIRINATRLFHVHNRAARQNLGLDSATELRIISEYFAIQVVCQILALAIWLRGPVNLCRLVRHADGLFQKLRAAIRELVPAEFATENDMHRAYPVRERREDGHL